MQDRQDIVEQESIRKTMLEASIPDVTIALVNNDGTIKTQEIGINNDLPDRVTPTTLFGAASLSKPVFSYLVLKLVQAGILTLEQPLDEILSFEEFFEQLGKENKLQWEKTPDDSNRAKSVNAKMILAHATGFDLFKGIMDFRFDPGTAYRYSGMPLIYLQKVIEKLTKQNLEALAKKYVFEPCGMKNSSFCPIYDICLMEAPQTCKPGKIYLKATEQGLFFRMLFGENEICENVIPWQELPLNLQPGNLAESIQSRDKCLPTLLAHVSKMRGLPSASAPNSLFTTAEDYALFVEHWMNDERMQFAFEPVISMTTDEWAKGVEVPFEHLSKLSCGMGFELEENGSGKPLAYKTGDMNLWRAQVAIDLEGKTAIVYFANGSNGHILANQIITPFVELKHGHPYFSQKYGFALQAENGWREKEKERFECIGKYLDSAQLEKRLEMRGIPGASVAIKNGDDVLTCSAGITDVTNRQPVTDQTLFEAASLSKPVFAYIVLKQIENGLFGNPGEPESGLDCLLYKIGEFGPPDVRSDPHYKKLTIRMLLSHQARLPNEFPSPLEEKFIAPEMSLGFDYSGEAYRLLNEMLQHVTGKSLWKLSREIFDDLKMHNTRFLPDQAGSSLADENRAVGHDAHGNKDETNHFPMSLPHPAASLITTAADYLKFLEVLMKDEFALTCMLDKPVALQDKDKKSLDANVPLSTLQNLFWGNGIGIQKSNGQTILFHWGDINTNRSFFAVNLQTNKAFVCLTNSANGPAFFHDGEKVVGDLTPALTWLKIREKLPIELSMADPSIPQLSMTRQFLEKWENIGNTDPLLAVFLEERLQHSDDLTFENILNEYSRYLEELKDPEDKRKLSQHFWQMIDLVKLPFIEVNYDGTTQVYFLYRQNEDNNNDFYVQGDYHGYGSTFSSQRLNRAGNTDVLYCITSIENENANALITYHFVAKPRYNTADASFDLNDQRNWLPDPHAKNSKAYEHAESQFCVNAENNMSIWRASESHEWPSMTEIQEDPRLTHWVQHPDGQIVSGIASFEIDRRSIEVFKPTQEVKNVIIVNDGFAYLLCDALKQLQDFAEKEKCVLIFISPFFGLGNPDDHPLGIRGLEYHIHVDQYSLFILDELLPELHKQGILPDPHPTNMTIIGASASGIAALRTGLTHPDRFGHIIAHSPAPIAREKIDEIPNAPQIASKMKIDIECGKFENPDNAYANDNLSYARELGNLFNIDVHVGLHGHQTEGWVSDLKRSLPAVLVLESKKDKRKDFASFFSKDDSTFQTVADEKRKKGYVRPVNKNATDDSCISYFRPGKK